MLGLILRGRRASSSRVLAQRPRAALRLLRRRGLALHQARGRDVPRPQPRLLPEPVGVHLPAARSSTASLAIPLGGGRGGHRRLQARTRRGSSRSRAALAAVLCLAGVGAVYFAGRALWDRRTGLLAAAVLCFAFLPVAFSPHRADRRRHARCRSRSCCWSSIRMTRPAACALARGRRRRRRARDRLQVHGRARAARARRSRSRWLLAAATRALRPARAGRARRVAGGARRLRPHEPVLLPRPSDRACTSCAAQADLAGNQGKFGQDGDDGLALLPEQPAGASAGVAAARRARGRACCSARRDRARAVVAARLPARAVPVPEPAGALLRPLAAARLPGARAARRLRGRRGGGARCASARRALELPAVARRRRCCSWQPLAADARSMAVLGHADTREIARDWLAAHHRPELRAVIEPAVPEPLLLAGRWTGSRARPSRAAVRQRVRPRTQRGRTSSTARTLRPQLIDRYRRRGLLHRGDDGPDPRPRRRARQPGAARLLRRAWSASPTSSSSQPVPAPTPSRSRSPSTCSYNYYSPRLRAARAGRRRVPARRLHAGLRRRGTPAEARTRRMLARRRSCAGRPGAAAVAPRPRAARSPTTPTRTSTSCRAAVDDGGRREPGPGLLREPAGADVPAARSCYWIGGTARRAPRPRVSSSRSSARSSWGSPTSPGSAAFEPRAGLMAAALMAVAFLPVFYSKHALNDIVTMAPVTRRA